MWLGRIIQRYGLTVIRVTLKEEASTYKSSKLEKQGFKNQIFEKELMEPKSIVELQAV